MDERLAQTESANSSCLSLLEFDLKMYDPRSVQIRISNAKNTMQMPEDILSVLDDANINQKKFVEIYKMYQKKLQDFLLLN